MVESTNNYIGKKNHHITPLLARKVYIYMYIVDSSNAQLVMIIEKKKKKSL